MDHFNYRDNTLYAEDVALASIAEQYGTPCYVYSRATLERHWHACDTALGDHEHLICYAVKANSNLAVLNLFARLGSGFDVVSLGELERVVKAGGDPQKVVFSGVGKLPNEIKRALELKIYCFNVESLAELEMIQQIASELGVIAPIALRVNPDVDAKTHPYIATGLRDNKFGIPMIKAVTAYKRASDLTHIKIRGIACHIGSQITQLAPFLDALGRIQALEVELNQYGIMLEHLDLGGGLGVRYKNEEPPHPRDHAAAIRNQLADSPLKIILEPGRAIAANAGVLVTRVLYLKDNGEKHFAIMDAGMNDMLRPALYSAWQDVWPLQKHTEGQEILVDLVGPVCETADFLAKERNLILEQGDLLAVRSAGAYGFSMSSNYNTRPRAAEVMVDGDRIYLIRQRETIPELFATEAILP